MATGGRVATNKRDALIRKLAERIESLSQTCAAISAQFVALEQANAAAVARLDELMVRQADNLQRVEEQQHRAIKVHQDALADVTARVVPLEVLHRERRAAEREMAERGAHSERRHKAWKDLMSRTYPGSFPSTAVSETPSDPNPASESR
jgi:chromosome segregation ATPase